MRSGDVLGFLAAPDRQTCLRAISLALLRIRALDGMTCEKLGELMGCSADTIHRASNEETMLVFESIARLIYFFPDETALVRELWEIGATDLTLDERIERIERDLEAIRKNASVRAAHIRGAA